MTYTAKMAREGKRLLLWQLKELFSMTLEELEREVRGGFPNMEVAKSEKELIYLLLLDGIETCFPKEALQ